MFSTFYRCSMCSSVQKAFPSSSLYQSSRCLQNSNNVHEPSSLPLHSCPNFSPSLVLLPNTKPHIFLSIFPTLYSLSSFQHKLSDCFISPFLQTYLATGMNNEAMCTTASEGKKELILHFSFFIPDTCSCSDYRTSISLFFTGGRVYSINLFKFVCYLIVQLTFQILLPPFTAQFI